MRIGIDTRELSGKKAGKGWYVYHVLKGILELDSKNDYILYCRESIDFPSFPNAKVIQIHMPDLFWHFYVTSRLKKDKVDVFWAPTSPIIPAITDITSVFTVHDLTNFLFPEMHTLKGRLIEKLFFKRAVLKSKAILSVSEATRKDLVKYCYEIKRKISVTPLGYDQAFKPLPSLEVLDVLKRYKLKPGYILFVGTIEPRKNIEFLTDAFSLLDPKLKKEHPLVIVGKKGWLCDNIMEKINSAETVVYLDYAPFSDLPAIYNGCALFVFPSLYEGFGMPPLEAMACGRAVIVSNVSSLLEVTGEVGIKIDPKNINNLAKKITRVLTDKEFRKSTENKSSQQAKKFSWGQTAKMTLEILRKFR